MKQYCVCNANMWFLCSSVRAHYIILVDTYIYYLLTRLYKVFNWTFFLHCSATNSRYFNTSLMCLLAPMLCNQSRLLTDSSTDLLCSLSKIKTMLLLVIMFLLLHLYLVYEQIKCLVILTEQLQQTSQSEVSLWFGVRTDGAAVCTTHGCERKGQQQVVDSFLKSATEALAQRRREPALPGRVQPTRRGWAEEEEGPEHEPGRWFWWDSRGLRPVVTFLLLLDLF